MLKKRGQLTVFIIIGILLLALLGVFLYIRQSQREIEVPEYIPERLVPIRDYVNNCIRETLKDATILLGMQGGYIYLPERIAYDPTSHISYGQLKVPYWYYQGRSRIPTKEGMESEIERYVNENLDRCLRDFDIFNKEFDIKVTGNKSTKVRIEEGKITAKTTMALEILEKDTEALNKITKFSTGLDVDLLRIFNLAKEIIISENNNMYLEKVTIDLMAAGPEIPFTDISFECGKKRWYKPEIEGKIKDLLFYNLPKIRIVGTRTVPFLEHYSKYELLRGFTAEDIGKGIRPKEKDRPKDAYEYFHFQWHLPRTNDYSNLKVRVNYQRDWDFF
ncbi:MAG: hypothetical protein N3D84_03015, partial [Candidatus Woesearchaeota archaeon]|nr:hypothetical protein [Candidatus Woesearchaeota archaeon]